MISSRIGVTQGVQEAIDNGLDVAALLARHFRRDWGDMCDEDKAHNDSAIIGRGRLHSTYVVGGVRYYVITDAGWETTTVMLPDEY